LVFFLRHIKIDSFSFQLTSFFWFITSNEPKWQAKTAREMRMGDCGRRGEWLFMGQEKSKYCY